MKHRPLPPLEYLRACFTYDAETGVLTWRERPREHFKTERTHRLRNARFAGETAGGVSCVGYFDVSIDTVLFRLHRIAYAMHHGADPGVMQVDHINGNRADNRASNLRLVSRSGNARNQRLHSNNTSGFSGVYWDRRDCRWRAQIRGKKRRLYLGSFDCIGAAVIVRHLAECKHGFHPNHGRAA